MLYPSTLKKSAQNLRLQGNTFSEIKTILKTNIPQSTLSTWCNNLKLTQSYYLKIKKLNQSNLTKARKIAWKTNKIKREIYLKKLNLDNESIAQSINNNQSTWMIALAMLCLGEASKSKSKHQSFSLGSSDPRIIIIFLTLLKRFPTFNIEKVRCTIQCRADQNIDILGRYWRNVTNIPKKFFYNTRLDLRTIGKPTKNKDYKGVLVIDYFDRNIQLKLESLANLVYNQLKFQGP